ncbi:MAG TPA: hypothetical protein PKM72_10805, partial [Nitrospirales bacterium]|nr:hypothetical protein [Nitrospirales bacterium]
MLGMNRDLLGNYKNDVGIESNHFACVAWTNRWKLGKIEKASNHETCVILTEIRCCVSETKPCPSC